MPVAVLSEYPAVSATGEGKRGEWEERGRVKQEENEEIRERRKKTRK